MLLQRSLGWFALINFLKEIKEVSLLIKTTDQVMSVRHWWSWPLFYDILLQEMSGDFNFTKIFNHIHAFPIPLLFLPGNKLVTRRDEERNQMEKSAKKYCLPPWQGDWFICLKRNKHLLQALGLNLNFVEIPTFQINSISLLLFYRLFFL